MAGEYIGALDVRTHLCISWSRAEREVRSLSVSKTGPRTDASDTRPGPCPTGDPLHAGPDEVYPTVTRPAYNR